MSVVCECCCVSLCVSVVCVVGDCCVCVICERCM